MFNAIFIKNMKFISFYLFIVYILYLCKIINHSIKGKHESDKRCTYK